MLNNKIKIEHIIIPVILGLLLLQVSCINSVKKKLPIHNIEVSNIKIYYESENELKLLKITDVFHKIDESILFNISSASDSVKGYFDEHNNLYFFMFDNTVCEELFFNNLPLNYLTTICEAFNENIIEKSLMYQSFNKQIFQIKSFKTKTTTDYYFYRFMILLKDEIGLNVKILSYNANLDVDYFIKSIMYHTTYSEHHH
jgi:hypothetical protein